MKNVEILKNIIQKYQLESPVPSHIQSFMAETKKAVLINTLKSIGIYSAYFGAILRVFFSVKKLGISLTINQTIGVIFIASSVLLTSIASGGYYAVSAIIKDKDEKIEEIQEEIEQKTDVIIDKPQITEPVKKIKKKKIQNFEKPGIDDLKDELTAEEKNIGPTEEKLEKEFKEEASKEELKQEEIKDRVESIPPL